MHLLSAQPGGFCDDTGIVDLQQTPADIVVLAAQDSTLALLTRTAEQLPARFPSVRIANFMHLVKPAAFDLYLNSVLQHCRVIVVSLLGGQAYWPYGVESLRQLVQDSGIKLALLPGDDHLDTDLLNASNIEHAQLVRLWRYLREGGERNANNFFLCIKELLTASPSALEEPRALPRAMLYHPQHGEATLAQWQNDWPLQGAVVALLFYRSHVQSGNTHAFNRLITLLLDAGLCPLPIAIVSLKDPSCLAVIQSLCAQCDVQIVLNTTSFAVNATTPEASEQKDAEQAINLDVRLATDAVVFQVIMASSSQLDWEGYSQGLRARDIAMNIALPEMDGRVITRAVSFKQIVRRSERTQTDIIEYRLHDDRAQFVIEMAQRYIQLRTTPNSQKRIALILANYPTRDGRIGNGVGLDTPASVINILRQMVVDDYPVADTIPENGTVLIETLLRGVTNDLDWQDSRVCYQSLALTEYQQYFAALPESNQQAVIARWGLPEEDPKVRQGRIMIAGLRLGLTFIGIQPARGYN